MFLPNVANEEAGIAQVAIINQFPRRDGDEHLILRVELSILVGEKSLHQAGLEPTTFIMIHTQCYPTMATLVLLPCL